MTFKKKFQKFLSKNSRGTDRKIFFKGHKQWKRFELLAYLFSISGLVFGIILLMNTHTHEIKLPDSCKKAVNSDWTEQDRIACDLYIENNKDEVTYKFVHDPQNQFLRSIILITSVISTVLFCIMHYLKRKWKLNSMAKTI